MLVIVGFLVVAGAVFGGFMLSGGHIIALYQPFELLIIGGAALGAFLVSNPASTVKQVFKKLPSLLDSHKFGKPMYMDLLSLLYDLFSKARREGMMAIEEDVENPNESAVFAKYPAVIMDQNLTHFIADYLRIVSSGNLAPHELEALMDQEIEARYEELEQPAAAVTRVSDALPGFGIVAAVLGIVITMESMNEGPEVIGHHVAAALVGTFLGILLAYGFVGPVGTKLEHMAQEEIKLYECIKTCLLANVNGMPPQMCVEFGRKVLNSEERPTFHELEDHVRNKD